MDGSLPDSQRCFESTHWSIVLAAGKAESDQSQQALAELCRKYWQPLYGFVRRSGYQPADAQDLTQAFFERLIEHRFIQAADKNRGRFRTFVLAALKNFISNEWQKARRVRRGGGTVLSLDFAGAESQLSLEAVNEQTADAQFDREWAVGLLSRVVDQLQTFYAENGNEETFIALQPYLTADGQRLPYQKTADEHGMSIGQVKVNVHRLRTRYRELLELEIGGTVGSAEQVAEEIRALFAALQ